MVPSIIFSVPAEKWGEMAVNVNKLISLEEAQSLILATVSPLATEAVQLSDASGRILAEDVRASKDEPSIPLAAMDGYGVQSMDVEFATPQKGVVLPVVGAVSAGDNRHHELNRGEAVKVMTGAPLPVGADAVVPMEMTEGVSEGIRITTPVAQGDYIVPAGAEFHQNQQLLSSGAVLRPNELTILAALGYTMVTVRKKPEVAVLATGTELVEVGTRLGPGQTFASNLHTVAHLVKRCGGKTTSLDIAGDNLDNLVGYIQRGMKADVVVTTGGTGKGDKDLVSAAITTLNGDLCFRGIAMTPGKQTLFAKLGGTLFFGLPGRPTATYIAFEQLVRPALFRMLGLSPALLPEITARLSRTIQVKGKILSFLFCRLIFGPEGPQVESLRSGTRGILTEMLAANGLLKVPPGIERLEQGELVRVQPLDLGLEGLSYFSAPQQ